MQLVTLKPSNDSSRTSTPTHYLPIIVLVVSNIEAIQSQLKNIYTNTLSTLCPLPWLEKAEDAQYNFDDVFIPLRTIHIPIQQRKGDLPGPSDKIHKKRKTSGLSLSSTADMPGPSGSRYYEGQTGDLPESSNEKHMKRKTSDLFHPLSSSRLPGPSSCRNYQMPTRLLGNIEPYHQTRYTYNNIMLFTNT